MQSFISKYPELFAQLEEVYGELLNKFYEEVKNDLTNTRKLVNPIKDELLVTVNMMKFHSAADIESIWSNNSEEKIESINFVRYFNYQDLIFSPNYLNYFFKRSNQNGEKCRIIVIKECSQVSLIYVLLSFLAKYNTYVIKDQYFKEFREKHITASDIQYILKGNPYIEKKGAVYDGKYSTYHNDGNPTIMSLNNDKAKQMYEIFTCLKNNYCTEIVEPLTSADNLETILKTRKISPRNCCIHLDTTNPTYIDIANSFRI